MSLSFTPHGSRSRVPVLLSVLAMLLAGAAAVVGGPYVRGLAAGRRSALPTAAEARAQRMTPVVDVAPAPLPTALPLVGPDEGVPGKHVDRPAFRTLLLRGRYATLNGYFDELQTSFETDPTLEQWPADAANAFASPDEALRVQLDAWVVATPAHFAPYLARGEHLTAVGFAARGTDWAHETPGENFAAMDAAFSPARVDLEKAVNLRPKLVAAMVQQIDIAMASRHIDLQPAVDRAISTCPTCFLTRSAALEALEPRWGGSYAAMAKLAAAAPVKLNAKLRLLPGYIDVDQGNVLWTAGKLDEALIAFDRACALGDHWAFLLARGKLRSERKEHAKALIDLDRALALRPGSPPVLVERARVHGALRHAEPAGRDLLAALRVRATDTRARWLRDYVVGLLVYEAHQQGIAGRRADALRLFDLAAELAPENRDVIRRRSEVVVSGIDAAGNDLAALEAAAAAAPNDFRAHQRLDYALARQRRFERIAEIWDGYLTRNPGDAQAYFERAGTYHHLHRSADALADFTKACELGSTEGCAMKRRFAGAR